MISGRLPSPLYPNLNTFAASGNSISGSIPSGWLDSYATTSLPALEIDLSVNQLSGTLPENLVNFNPNNPSATSTSFVLALANNELSGTIPTNLFGSAGYTLASNAIILDLANNRLSGTLPAFLLSTLEVHQHSSLGQLLLNFQGNHLESTIPNLVGPYFGAISTLEINLSNNNFSGRINSPLIGSNMVISQALTLNFAYNQFSSLPHALLQSSLFTASPDSTILINVDMSHNKLMGSIPPSLLSSFAPDATTPLALDFDISFNPLLTDELPLNLLPAFFLNRGHSVSAALNFANCNFNGSIPGFWSGYPITRLQVDANHRLSGSLPVTLFNSSRLSYFSGPNTGLSGEMPSLNASTWTGLYMDHSSIDFCSSSSDNSVGSAPTWRCSLSCTNAWKCPGRWMGCDTSCPSDCPIATRPSPDFVCIGGAWTFPSSYERPVLSVPSGAAVTVITGNLTSDTILFDGFGSTLSVTGCINNLSAITIQLSLKDLEKIGKSNYLQTLLSYGNSSNGCSVPRLVDIKIGLKDSSCKKVQVQSTRANASTFAAVFSVDNSRCNRWWIILVSIVCGVIVLLALIFALLVAFVPTVRSKIRPYSRPKAQVTSGLS